MVQTAVDNQLIIEDVVSSLTGRAEGVEQGSESDLAEQMQRAAQEVDKRTAHAFGKALLDHLCEEPGNLRLLEALLILGLAHPDVLRRHRISMAVEGRRLAILLERAGEVERARCLLELLSSRLPHERTIDHELAGILRRSGNTEELIDRYLQRAEDCVEEGKVSEAIPWLQEILLLDRTRRDVARMIRDLRYQEAERRIRVRRRNRLLLLVVLVTTAVSAVFARERQIEAQWSALADPKSEFPHSLYARHEGIESLIDEHKVWAGLWEARQERESLGAQIEEYEAEQARVAEEQEREAERLEEMAEAARLRALAHFERGEYDEALADFRRSLSMSSEDWTHRGRVEANVAALEAWDGGQE